MCLKDSPVDAQFRWCREGGGAGYADLCSTVGIAGMAGASGTRSRDRGSWSRTRRARPRCRPSPAALIAGLSPGCRGEEMDHRRLQVVHRPGDLNGARGLELRDDGTAAADLRHGELDILQRHRVDEAVVLRGALALIRGSIHRRLDLGEQAGEVAELDPVDGTLDRAARGVAHHQHDLRAGYLAGELHATEDVVVGDVAGHAGVEHVADAEVHDRLGGRAGVDAAQDHRGRILSLRARSLLSQVVLRGLLPRSEALIASLHELDDLVRRQLVALRLGQCGGPGNPARERGANEGDRAGYARGVEECSAAEPLRIGHVILLDRAWYGATLPLPGGLK